jgi:two-component system LytT family response regulator
MLKTVVIDDQEFCTEAIKDILEDSKSDTKVVAVCHSGTDGLKAIKKHDPDLVILDVEMPEMTGFEMLQKIKKPEFEIIFTTSFDKYSIQAIRLSALDYLLKPIIPHELVAAVERAKQNVDQHSNLNKNINSLYKNLSEGKRMVNQVAFPCADGLIFLSVNEIVHCESDSNYTTIFLKSKEKIVITKTLKEVEALLEGNDFFRIHNSHLINIGLIKRYVRGNAGYVIMVDGSHLNIGRNRKEEFLKQFVHF